MSAGSDTSLVLNCLRIVLIDLLLGGDNALVIAMAVRALPQEQRRLAISCGAAAAVVLRIILTIVAVRLLGIQFLRLAGGAFVIWIAVKVLADAGSQDEEHAASHTRLIQAIGTIVFADITMSLDNVLAVAGAAAGSIPLIVFGLAISIPFVVFSSNLIAKLMDRYSAIVYLGAAILGEVGAEMMIGDPFVESSLHLSPLAARVAEGAVALGVILIGHLICRRARVAANPSQ